MNLLLGKNKRRKNPKRKEKKEKVCLSLNIELEPFSLFLGNEMKYGGNFDD